MPYLGLAAKAVLFALGAIVGAAVGGVGGLLALDFLKAPEEWACVADNSCGPGDGLLTVVVGLSGAILGGITGLVAAGVALMRGTLRNIGIARASDRE